MQDNKRKREREEEECKDQVDDWPILLKKIRRTKLQIEETYEALCIRRYIAFEDCQGIDFVAIRIGKDFLSREKAKSFKKAFNSFVNDTPRSGYGKTAAYFTDLTDAMEQNSNIDFYNDMTGNHGCSEIVFEPKDFITNSEIDSGMEKKPVNFKTSDEMKAYFEGNKKKAQEEYRDIDNILVFVEKALLK